MAKITIKNDIIEMMLFGWDSVSQREKVSDTFTSKLANHEDMKYIYGEDFEVELYD